MSSGQIVTRTFPGFGVEDVRVPPATRFRRHEHGGHHLSIVLSGGFIEDQRGGAIEAPAGTVRVSPPCRHDIAFGAGGARCLVVDLEDGSWPSGSRGLERSVFLRDDWLIRIARTLAAELSSPDPASTLSVETSCLELLAQVERRRGKRVPPVPPRWLRDIRDRLVEGEIPSLEALAARAGIHRAHLARAFREHYGQTVGGYARRIRLLRASRMLQREDAPLVRVAHLAGYADQSHMTREVSRAFGMSPARLRALGVRTQLRFKTGAVPAA